jgi:hypothetical protein
LSSWKELVVLCKNSLLRWLQVSMNFTVFCPYGFTGNPVKPPLLELRAIKN